MDIVHNGRQATIPVRALSGIGMPHPISVRTYREAGLMPGGVKLESAAAQRHTFRIHAIA